MTLSPRSSSRYIFAIKADKTAAIRISDHVLEINPKFVFFHTKKRKFKDFYLHTEEVSLNDPAFYELEETDKLIADVVEYLNVSSNQQEP